PLVSMAARRRASWRARASRMVSGCSSHSRVLPSMSVKRKVTVPPGRVDMNGSEGVEMLGKVTVYLPSAINRIVLPVPAALPVLLKKQLGIDFDPFDMSVCKVVVASLDMRGGGFTGKKVSNPVVAEAG